MTVALTSEKDRQKVVAAIIAGVAAYIGEELPGGKRIQVMPVERRRLAVAVNLWPVSGREEIMRMRTLWQRRMV